MAINFRQRFYVQQAKLQRLQLPRYVSLDGGRYLVVAALLLSLLSLLVLGQTGQLTAKGYQLAQLDAQRKALQHERSDLLLRLSEAQSLKRVEAQSKDMGLRPATADQTRYLTAGPEDSTPSVSTETPDRGVSGR